MPQEREAADVCMTDAAEAAPEGIGRLGHEFGAEIGHLAALDIVPDAFDRVEIRRVSGEPLNLQPIALGPQELRNFLGCGERASGPQ